VDAVLSTVARDAIDLLASGAVERVRTCGGDDCTLLFVDSSRPGKRRWCSMEICGNKAKAADLRRRRAGARGQG
jgi:predicted RNA-binding Zn ribbon-like protein